MGGLNSLGGLNRVGVDFRPAIQEPQTQNSNRPQQAPEIQPDGGQPSALEATKTRLTEAIALARASR